jgi:hypothetical protein
MPDLIRWLISEPLVWLIVASWLFSTIGGQMQKAARKARGEQERKVGGAPEAGPAGRRGPDPEEIAREIRRAMGLERAGAPPKPAEPPPARRVQAPRKADGIGGAEAPRRIDYDEQTAAAAARAARSYDEAPPRVTVVYDQDRPRRTLREELEARDAAQQARDVRDDAGRSGVPGAGRGDRIRDRHLGVPIDEIGGLTSRRHAPLFDLSRPAAGIIALEVLGPPVALRDRPALFEA